MTQPNSEQHFATLAAAAHDSSDHAISNDKATTSAITSDEHTNKDSAYRKSSSSTAAPNKAELVQRFLVPVAIDQSVAAPDTQGSVAEQRLALYRDQHERTRLLYLAPANVRPTYLVQTLKTQFAEYQQFTLAKQLDKRGLLEVESIERLW